MKPESITNGSGPRKGRKVDKVPPWNRAQGRARLDAAARDVGVPPYVDIGGQGPD